MVSAPEIANELKGIEKKKYVLLFKALIEADEFPEPIQELFDTEKSNDFFCNLHHFLNTLSKTELSEFQQEIEQTAQFTASNLEDTGLVRLEWIKSLAAQAVQKSLEKSERVRLARIEAEKLAKLEAEKETVRQQMLHQKTLDEAKNKTAVSLPPSPSDIDAKRRRDALALAAAAGM